MKHHRLWVSTVLIFLAYVSLVNAEATNDLTIEDRARMGEIYSLERLKKHTEAKPMVETLRQKYPDNPEIKWTYVRILGFAKEWEEASKIFDELCADPKDCDAEMIETYGHILEAQGPNPGTLVHIKKLVDLHPDMEKLKPIYEQILSWNTQNAQGQKALEDLYTQYPDDLNITQALGDAAYFAKDYELAETQYAKILKQGESATIRKKYVDSLIGQKKYTEALSEMDQVLSADPHNKELLYQHAQVLAAMGKHEESVEELKVLLEEDFKKPEVMVMLGDELRQLGQNDEALKIYQEVTNEK